MEDREVRGQSFGILEEALEIDSQIEVLNASDQRGVLGVVATSISSFALNESVTQ